MIVLMEPNITLLQVSDDTRALIEQIKTQGLCRINYPGTLKAGVAEYVQLWKRFCALPAGQKTRFTYFDGVGYELKDNKNALKDPENTGKGLDHKEDAHITLGRGGDLLTVATFAAPEAAAFVEAGLALIPQLEKCIEQFALAMELGFNLPGFRDEVMSGQDSWWLRSLHYFGDRTVGDEIASAHTDKSGFTLHLHESDPGLEFLDISTREWSPAPVMDTETVIFPGMQTQLKSTGVVKALCHRVVATEKTAKTGRFSVVCFIPLPETARYNKNAAGRLQERKPGFNYDVTTKEFGSLFIV